MSEEKQIRLTITVLGQSKVFQLPWGTDIDEFIRALKLVWEPKAEPEPEDDGIDWEAYGDE